MRALSATLQTVKSIHDLKKDGDGRRLSLMPTLFFSLTWPCNVQNAWGRGGGEYL